ncbi:LLM class flavin-dependent oxidoreductase [Ornithinimicrobium pratense]|uniref:LLM class flavin-dependent oxidoreductase n=1 Tax=Ornithinimicrobium pratense TaxID=2593973 RepID=A0A5J6V610_9MICO|nr:LLM class flavin-dependent oxidoreductase [Ornithinimicrobium pratense]QFG68463.1 LLM class flavin-dependent oxidoreductase [Ornithinimicrobium pratense]
MSAPSHPLEVALRVPLGAPLPELATFATEVERAGLDGIGVPDHHHTGRDAYLALAAMGMATNRLRLFPATSNVVTRHPIVLASLVASLDELAPGRSELTVAPGFLSVEKAGEAQAKRAVLGEAVRALRGLLHEGRADHGGRELQLFHHPRSRAGLVHVLASGPRLLELAGAVGDGVLMLVGLHPDGVQAARAHVRAGAERAGRPDPYGPDSDFVETLIVPIGLGTRDEVRAWPRSWFRDGQPWLHYPSRSNLRWLSASGLDLPELGTGPDLTDPASLPDALVDDLLDAYGLFGPPEQCADRLLRARDELGMQRAFLFPAHTWTGSYDLPHDVVKAWSSTMRPRLTQAG